MAQKTESKAAVIRRRYAELGGGAEAVKIIAEELGCRREYVRIAARQRVHNGLSPSDIRYRAKPDVQAALRPLSAARQRRYYHRHLERMRAMKRARYHLERRAALAAQSESA